MATSAGAEVPPSALASLDDANDLTKDTPASRGCCWAAAGGCWCWPRGETREGLAMSPVQKTRRGEQQAFPASQGEDGAGRQPFLGDFWLAGRCQTGRATQKSQWVAMIMIIVMAQVQVQRALCRMPISMLLLVLVVDAGCRRMYLVHTWEMRLCGCEEPGAGQDTAGSKRAVTRGNRPARHWRRRRDQAG